MIETSHDRQFRPWQCDCGHEAGYGDGLYQRTPPNGRLGWVCEHCRQMIDFGRVLEEQEE